MYFHDSILTLMAFFSELVGTISGFGSSTFFVPLALLVESFHLVLVLTGILHCFGNSWRIIIFRKHFHLPSFLLLVLPTIAFVGLGAVLTVQFSTVFIQKVLGVVLIFISLFLLFNQKLIKVMPKWLATFLSIMSGFLTGFVGTGGVFRGLALTALKLPKNTFIMTSASVDIGGDLLRTFIYLKNGYMDWDQWFYIPMLGTAAFLGIKVGKRIIDKLNQKQFENMVSIFIFLSGVLMLIKN